MRITAEKIGLVMAVILPVIFAALLPLATLAAADPLPAPTLVPFPGTFAAPIPVWPMPSGPTGSVVRCTLDGADPTPADPILLQPWLLTDDTLVKARRFTAAGVGGLVATGIYRIHFPLVPARPTVTPSGGAYAGAVTVALATATTGAIVRYTTNGSWPTATSPRYVAPVILTQSTILRARSFGGTVRVRIGPFLITLPTILPSGITSTRYTITPSAVVAAPVFNPPPGIFTDLVPISLSTRTASAVVRYTTDGSAPITASPVAAAPIVLSTGTTLRAIAVGPTGMTSLETSGIYQFQVAMPVLTPGSGTFTDVLTVHANSDTPYTTIHFTTDGADPRDDSPGLPITGFPVLSTGITLRAFASRPGWRSSSQTIGAYILKVADPLVSPPGGTRFADGVEVIAASATPQAAVVLTVDGSDPQVNGITSSVIVRTAATVKTQGFRAGFVPSDIITAEYFSLPRAKLTEASLTISEGGAAILHLTLSQASDGPVTIGYDIARASDDGSLLSQDLGNVGGQVIFPPGDTHMDISVATLADGLDEMDESFVITLLTADGAAIETTHDHCVLTVNDEDPTPTVMFLTPFTAVTESAGNVDIPLRLSSPSGRDVTVRISCVRGTARVNADFGPAVVEVTILAGATEGHARFAIYDDTWAESDEYCWLHLDAIGESVLVDSGEHHLIIRSEEFASPVADWLEVAGAEIARHNVDPPRATRILALLGVAMDRAARTVPEDETASVSSVGAITAAAVECLSHLFPDRAANLRQQAIFRVTASEWSGLSNEEVANTSHLGAVIAHQVLDEASSDGSTVAWPVTPPVGPGYWYSSWAYIAPPTRPWWGTVRPWFMESGSSLRPLPPPSFDSPDFAAALAEVRTISDTRTNEQLAIAGKWADGPGSITPPGHWLSIAATLFREHRTDDRAAAHAAGLLGATMMDAGIACWDAKYAYWLIRPYQADRSISTPIGQPNFPSYVSGHSAFSGAASVVLGHLYPTHAAALSAMADEAALSRLYGGIHYRFDNEIGLQMGRAIGQLAVADDADGVWRADVAPQLIIQNPAPGATLTASPTDLRWLLTDHDSAPASVSATVTLTNGHGTVIPCAVSLLPQTDGTVVVRAVPTATLIEGRYTGEAIASDPDGHTSHGTLRFAVDPTGAPVVRIDSPLPEALVGMSGPVTVRGSVNQAVESLIVNGGPVSVANDGTFTVDLTVDGNSATRLPLTLMGGINEIIALAVDPAGTSGAKRFEIRVDDSRPTVHIETPAEGSWTWTPTVTVTGFVQDIVLGSIDNDNVTVTIAGRPATVRNGTFLVADVPLMDGTNQLVAEAVDVAGNHSSHTIAVERRPEPSLHLDVLSGDGQETAPLIPMAPVLVRLMNGSGMPVARHPVTFTVSRGDGTLADADDDARQRRQVLTDASGQASVTWTLGTRSGLGNQRLAVSALGSDAITQVTASVIPAAPAWILVAEGQSQTGLASQALPQPIIVRLVDIHGNPLVGSALQFTVTTGEGVLKNPAASTLLGESSVTIATDKDGRASALWMLGSTVGPETHTVTVSTGHDDVVPTSFVATAVSSTGLDADTALSGIVLGSDQRPLSSVTLVIEGGTIGAVSDANGAFLIKGLPAGHRHLMVMGTTANTDSVRYPTLGFEVDLLKGATLTMPMPIYVPAMDVSNQQWVGGDAEVILDLPGVLGAQVVIAPHSTIRPDGIRGAIKMYTAPVNTFALPMPPPGGVVPPIAASLQPPGIRLDPPARVRWPNVQAMPPGSQVGILSFDHDLGVFVNQGQATVTPDGLYMVSDLGTGITKSGWHFPDGTPIPSADCEGTVPLILELTGPTEVVAGMQVEYTVREKNGRPLPALTWTAAPLGGTSRVLSDIVMTTASGVTVHYTDSGNTALPVRNVLVRVAPVIAGANGPVAVELTVTVSIERLIAVDGNRDGMITFDEVDLTSAVLPWRWWKNDDEDSPLEIDPTGDVPLSDPLHPNILSYNDMFHLPNNISLRVNGVRDLVDWFPIAFNLHHALDTFPPSAGYEYALRCSDNGVSVVWSNVAQADAFAYLTTPQHAGYGPSFGESFAETMATEITAEGILVPPDFLALGRVQPAYGVAYLEGVTAGQSVVELLIRRNGIVVSTSTIHLRLSAVEEMFRWINVHHVASPVEGLDSGELPENRHTDLQEPVNLPDRLSNGTQVILVHGFNVDEPGARGWCAEMFKRLYQSGSRAMFTGVAWPGHESDAAISFAVADYHLSVQRAFEVAPALAHQVLKLPGRRRVVISHSLGAGVAGSMLADYGIRADRYFAVDAAMSSEAYDGEHEDAVMIHPDWCILDRRARCSEWYRLWPDSDGRSRLTWRNRFGLIPGMVNLYSSGEDVLGNGDGTVSERGGNLIGEIYRQAAISPGLKTWYLQEIGKGRAGPASLSIDHWHHGGWGFSFDYNYDQQNIFTGVIGPPPPDRIAALTVIDLRIKPVFSAFSDARIVDENEGSDAAKEPFTRTKLLAETIPATSVAMGRNALKQNGQDLIPNFDMQASVNGWPIGDKFHQYPQHQTWHHSDIKDVAFLYVWKAFAEIVRAGDLK